MILLDTNVISELWRPAPAIEVVSWLDAAPSRTLHLSIVTLAELRFGACRLPEGRRRTELLSVIGSLETRMFAGRVLAFDAASAEACGRLRADRERAGKPVSFADAAIAGTALRYGLRLATRNIDDFAGTGIDLVNPFTD